MTPTSHSRPFRATGWVRASAALALAAWVIAETIPAAAVEYLRTRSALRTQETRILLPDTGIPNVRLTPSDVVAGDFNHDGLADLAIAFAFNDEVQWFFGSGEGFFFAQEPALSVGIHDGPFNDLPRELIAHDFDEDGLLDLAVVNSGVAPGPGVPAFAVTDSSVGILYGIPRGGFESFRAIPLLNSNTPAPLFSSTLEMGLINDDERMDLLVGHFDSRQITYLANGGGRAWAARETYEIETPGPGPADLKLVDLNFDGISDLIVTNRADIQVWRGASNGDFLERAIVTTGESFTAAATADFDQNGHWDLVALDASANVLRVFMNLNAAGEFGEDFNMALTGGLAPIDLVVYDANRDGRDDVALIYLTTGGGEILLGQPDRAGVPLARGRAFATSRRPRALTASDLDGDQRPDLVIVNEGDFDGAQNEDVVIDLNTISPVRAGLLTAAEEIAPADLPMPAVDRPRGLDWDARRRGLWTIDRFRRLLVLLSVSGEVRRTIPLETLFSQAPVEPLTLGVFTDPTLVDFGPLDPTDLAADGAGGLWITDRLSALVIHINGAGRVVNLFSTLPAGIGHPTGIAWDDVEDRLFVGSEFSRHIAAFTVGGDVLGLWSAATVRDLAWDGATGLLWAIAQQENQAVLAYELDPDSAEADLREAFDPQRIASILRNESARSIALDAETGRFWLLTDRGDLIEYSRDGELSQIHELTLLREIKAMTSEPEGTLLLTDGGMLGTLVRIDPLGGILDSFSINSPDDSNPIFIRGLTRGEDRIFVLDGNKSRIEVLTPGGERVRSYRLEPVPRLRAHGLYFDPIRSHWFVGTQGRMLEFALPLVPIGGILPPGQTDDPQLAALHPVPAGNLPSSISRGQNLGEIAVFSARRATLLMYQPTASLNHPLRLRQVLNQTLHFPIQFRPITAAPDPGRAGDWILGGSGTPNLIRATLTAPTSGVGEIWRYYD